MTRTDRPSLRLLPWIGLTVALAALLAVTLLWLGARRDAAGLRAWQGAMLHRIGAADTRPGTAVAPPTPADAADALGRIVAARDGALAMAAAGTPATVGDTAAPGTVGAASSDSSGEISRLRATQSTGTAAGDAQIIEQDSRAAWTGWK